MLNFRFIRKVAQEEYDRLSSKLQSSEESEGRTMLQQFLINKKKSNLDMTIIGKLKKNQFHSQDHLVYSWSIFSVSVMSELLLAAFDTVSVLFKDKWVI